MKIGREATDICHHCREGRDTTQHTLEFCPAWELPRYRQEIGLLGDRGDDAGRAAGVRGCPLLLRASYTRKGAGREGEREKLSLL